jgi:multicomponent Na+:H+ antiporter subunit G
MDWQLIRDIVVAVLLLVGCLMSLAAAVGLLRFGDVLSRMHAAAKPQVLGLGCLLAAVAVHQGRWSWLPVLVLIFVLQALTAPVSAHMVGRAAYRSKHLDAGSLVVDELAEVVEYAESGSGKDQR